MWGEAETLTICHRASVFGEDGTRKVQPFFDVGAEVGLLESAAAYLFGDSHESVTKDRQLDGIDGIGQTLRESDFSIDVYHGFCSQ